MGKNKESLHCPKPRLTIMIKPAKWKEGNRLINQVTLVGRLTKHPEVKHTADGTPLLQTTIAVSRPYRNAKGETDTDFIYCTVWGRLAETAARYSEKGSLVAVLGMIQTRNYKDPAGKTIYVTEVLVQTIRFLSKKQVEAQENEPPGVIETVPLI